MKAPTFLIERKLIAGGFSAIVGVDEAGAGALAGPLVAAAVVLPLNSRLKLIRDSKLLNHAQRERLYEQIIGRAAAFATGCVSVEEIMEFGLRPANYLAMRRAIDQIPQVDHVLVDAWTIPNLPYPQTPVIHGDRLVKSIAAASIIAKVTRDRLMTELSKEYPAYDFHLHKGYGTSLHRQAIKKHGPCPIHRLTYRTFQ